jgi:hypothetical protein
MFTRLNLKGRSRSIRESTAPDITCSENINLMHDHTGALMPSVDFKEEFSGIEMSSYVTYVHNVDTVKNTILISSTESKYNNTGTTYSNFAPNQIFPNPVKISHIGNMLIVSDYTVGQTYYALFDVSLKTYSSFFFLPNRMEPYSKINCDFRGTFGTTDSDIWFSDDPVLDKVVADTTVGKYEQSNYEAMALGKFNGMICLRIAYKLYDGTLFNASIPQVVYTGGNNLTPVNMDTTPQINYMGTNVWRINNYGYGTIQFMLKGSISHIDPAIFKSIVIFATKPVRRWNIQYDDAFNIIFPNSGITDSILNQIFYKVKEIPLAYFDTISEVWTNLDLGNINNIETNEPLILESNMNHGIAASTIKNYNSRLFIGDVKQKLFNKHTVDYNLESYPTGRDHIWEIELQTNTGIKRVWSDTYHSGPSYDTILTKAVIGYPDRRAFNLNIVRIVSEVNTIALSYLLTPHPTEDYSYKFFIPSPVSLLINPYINSIGYSAQGTVTIESRNDVTISDVNQVKTSITNNPFIFLYKNSYQVGDSKVMALASQAVEKSQGQFGQYPLLVFCQSSVSALNISTQPDVLIDSIVYISDESITSEHSLININGVIYFISNKGVMQLNGRDIQCISDITSTKFISNAIKIFNDANFQVFINNSKTVLLQNDIPESDDFFTLISSAYLSYSEITRELFVGPFKFSLKTLQWCKSSEYLTYAFNSNGVNYIVRHDNWSNILNLSTIATTQSYKEIFYISNPVKIVADDIFKKIERIYLRCYVKTGVDKYFGFYVYGSLDGINYQFITGTQNTGEFKDLALPRLSPSLKYLILMFAGNVSHESYISSVDVDFQEVLTGKLH